MKEMFEALVSNAQVMGWGLAFLAFVVVEAVTLNALVSIWFAAAALLAMFAAMAGLDFVWQLAIFAAASVILLVATKRIVKKLKGDKPDPNESYDIDKSAVVIEAICNEENKGRVRLDGVDWMARSENGEDIAEGAVVKVKNVDGSKLTVAR